MNPASLILLLAAAMASIIGTAVMLKNLRTSPEGFEDIEGFHYGEKDRLIPQHVRAETPEQHRMAA